MLTVCKKFEFAAHHKLPFHRGKCSRDHGHNYVVTVCVSGEIQDGEKATNEGTVGMVLDFSELTSIWSAVENLYLDHYSLNAVLPNPTAENLTMFLVDRMNGLLENLRCDVVLSKLLVQETGDSWVEWQP